MTQVFTLSYTFYPKPSTLSVFAVSDNKVVLFLVGQIHVTLMKAVEIL